MATGLTDTDAGEYEAADWSAGEPTQLSKAGCVRGSCKAGARSGDKGFRARSDCATGRRARKADETQAESVLERMLDGEA